MYDLSLQKEFIKKEVIKFSPEEWHKAQTPGGMNEHIIYGQGNLWNNASKFAPLLKSPEFKEEAEWRIVKNFDKSSPQTTPLNQHPAFTMYNIKSNIEYFPIAKPESNHDTSRFIEYREGQGTIIPYLAIPIAESDEIPGQYIKLSDIIVSPGSHQELAVTACRVLLNSETSGAPEVHYSKIPYRK